MALTCGRCGKDVGMLGRLTFDQKYKRCGDCQNVIKKRLEEWRKQFLAACSDGLLTKEEWARLVALRSEYELQAEEAVGFVQGAALNFLQRSFTFARSDGYLDEVEEAHIHWLITELRLAGAASHILLEMGELAQLRNIRQGRLETIKPNAVLPADELCYLERPAVYMKPGKTAPTEVPGRLIATNKKILFIAPSGGGEIPLNKVLNVTYHPTGIFLELSRKANNGFYKVPDPQLTAEIIYAVIRMATRQMVASGERDTRRIPQNVKTQVWQRDQGRCVQCKASEYLEFDHVIPHSKGGATSVDNLQLLCRKCNAAKGDRI